MRSDPCSGLLILGGFEGTKPPRELRQDIQKGRLGGVVFFSSNIESCQQVLEVLKLLFKSGERPPFMAIDHEGGRVMRLPEPVTQFPAMRILGRVNDLSLTKKVGSIMAKELQALGFNINFSPVVDVLTNPLNTVIGDRAFSNNPLSVAQHGTAMIHGLQEQGMIACAKHFPGHGDTKQDSHQELPFSSHSFKRLEQIELVPFRAAIKARVKMIMSAHILFEKIDHKYPATLSPKILTELLKKRLGFKGLIISDDIQMKAISSLYHPVEAAFLAIYAGADLILISKDGGTLEDIRKELDLEIKKSAWFKERVERSIFKTFKIRNKIINIPCQARELEEILKAKTHKVVLEDILKRIG